MSIIPKLSSQAIITTVAGADWYYGSNTGSALSFPLGSAFAVALDTSSNAYVLDNANCVVVKIAPNGNFTVVAGNGICGFSGDGGQATKASLRGTWNLVSPAGIAVDSAGNVIFADTSNNRVRKISPSGIISTIAGNGDAAFSGDNGPAVLAALWSPTGIAIDNTGNVFVADQTNDRIRKINPAGTISTVAGNGSDGFSGDGGPATSAKLSSPTALALDGNGNLYIADTNNNRVRKMDKSGNLTTVAGDGTCCSPRDGSPATSASVNGPSGVAVDGSGNVFIAQGQDNLVRKVSPANIINTFAGTGRPGFSGDNGPALNATLSGPFGLAVDLTGNLYIADTVRIRKVTTAGTIATIMGSGSYRFAGDGGPATLAVLNNPSGLTLDSAGALYVADQLNNRIRRISTAGAITTFAGNGLPGFSGDNGPASSASLQLTRPGGDILLHSPLAIDPSGNILIGDTLNGRVRKVNSSGVIATVAGGGPCCNNGEGGPATSASLGLVTGVAADKASNIFLSENNGSDVRKVRPDGSIVTFAGHCCDEGSSGDGGFASNALLSLPEGLAIDAQGNLFIADMINGRIRKVTPAGIITTVAGGGSNSSDGIAATGFLLNRPYGVAVDTLGNLFIADTWNHQVRKVNAQGIITTVAGTGVSGFSGDGGLASAATLSYPHSVAVDAAGNLYISDWGNHRIRKVSLALPSYTAAPLSLTFSAVAGTPVAGTQTIRLTSTVSGLAWSATAQTGNGQNWLTVSPGTGVMPATISVSADVTNLAPGSYQGMVVVNAPAATSSITTIAVTLTVASPLPAALAVQPASLTFQGTVAGASPPAQNLRIANSGGGTLNWSAAVQVAGAGNWLSLGSNAGSVTPTTPADVPVRVNASGLLEGNYAGSITVNAGSSGQASIPVYLILASPQQTLLVSQSGLTFIGIEGGGVVPSQQFSVLNLGAGVMNWTVQVVTPNCSWLSVTPAAGSSTGGSVNPPAVSVRSTSAGLSVGQYTCQLAVTAPGAANPMRVVSVIQIVQPPGSVLPPIVRPTGLVFVRPAGGTSPGSQNVSLASAATSGVQAGIGSLGLFGDPSFLKTSHSNVVVTPGQPVSITVQPDITALKTGPHYGVVTLGFLDIASGTFSSQNVNVLFVVNAAGSGAAVEGLSPPPVGACNPTQLYLKPTALGSNYITPVGYPVTVEAAVKDDCDTATTGATVIATFTTGDPPLALAHVGNGVYQNSWRPAAAATTTINFTAASAGLLPAKDSVTIGGQASSFAAISPGGIVPGASFSKGGGFAPGGIISVFGNAMGASARGQAAAVTPLPTALDGATINIGGLDAPLYFSSSGQINAQLPFEMPPGIAQAYLRLNRNGGTLFTDSEALTVIPASPGIFTTNSSGSGQGAVLIANTTLLAAPAGSVPGASSQPVQRGQFITVFCSGLGAVSNQPKSGAAAPGSPFAQVLITPSLTIGGVAAPVSFSGLAPGFVGLYQVNAQVPANVATGNSVPVILRQNGIASNTVSIAVQ